MENLTTLMLICFASVILLFGLPYLIVDVFPKIKEKFLDRLDRFNTEMRFNDMQKSFFLRQEMPCCKSKQYNIGPSGGLTTNIRCSNCGEKYNANIEGVGPPIIERI